MYNEELKEKYIEERTTTNKQREACRSLFNLCSGFEDQWNADLCTKTSDELSRMVEHLVGLRYHSIIPRLVTLKDYVRWCIANGVNGACDGMLMVEPNKEGRIREVMVSGPDHLQKCFDGIFDKEDLKTVDSIYRCYYWLAFAGMKESDAVLVKKIDVDIDNMVVNFNGVQYPIYRESIQAFRNAIECKGFEYHHPNYSKTVLRHRVDKTYLLSGVRSLPTPTTLRVEISKRAGSKNGHFAPSFHRIWLSGFYFRAFLAEKCGQKTSFIQAAENFMEGKTYKQDPSRNTLEIRKRRIAKNYQLDYERWKNAFWKDDRTV